MSIEGKTVFITGGARGIGAETARRAAARGANVAVVGLEPGELDRVATACGERGAAFECDVTNREQLQAAVDGTLARFGSIDAVVVNAGIGAAGLMRYADPDAFEAVIRVNLLGSWRTIRATLPHLIDSRGYLVQVASLAAVVNAPGMGAYAASKAGVEAMANALRTEVKHLGVGVGTAYFSWIGTDMVYGADESPIAKKARENLRGPLAKRYPVSDAANALIEGIDERRRIVVAPRWVRPLVSLRPLIQRLAEKGAEPTMPEIDELSRTEAAKGDSDAFAPVGAGGRAFAQADRRE